MISGPAGVGDCRTLFVYGSLRRGFELHHHLARLGARFHTEAKVAALLFDLGSYTGARPACQQEDWVHGEVFELRQPATDLEVLDEIEGIVPGSPEPNEFVRATTEVALNDGARLTCWIYWLAADKGIRGRVASGDYAEWRSRGTDDLNR